jgi:hypothetical protein
MGLSIQSYSNQESLKQKKKGRVTHWQRPIDFGKGSILQQNRQACTFSWASPNPSDQSYTEPNRKVILNLLMRIIQHANN